MTSTGPTNQARTIIGPLTTTFTPAPACVNAIAECSVSCSLAWLAQECKENDEGCQDATSCWPPASSGAPSPTPPFLGWGFYSPGLVCPSGFYPACTATAGGSSQWPVAYSMLEGETAIGCCPSSGSTSYTCAPNTEGGVQTCQQIASHGDSFAIATCQYGSSQGYSYMTLPYTTSATVGYVTASGSSGSSSYAPDVETYSYESYTLYAPMIQINWRSSDRPSLNAATATNTAGTVSTPAGQTSAASSPSGLSTGAKAAIGVVVPVVVLAALAGAILIWRRNRRKKASQDVRPHVDSHVFSRQELQGNPVHEMESHQNVQEMEHYGSKSVPNNKRHEVG